MSRVITLTAEQLKRYMDGRVNKTTFLLDVLQIRKDKRCRLDKTLLVIADAKQGEVYMHCSHGSTTYYLILKQETKTLATAHTLSLK